MAVEKYSIGGDVRETDANEAFADIPQNRVLLAQKLTTNPPITPKMKTGLTSIEEVFREYQPKVEVEFENEAGGSKKETLSFTAVSDFGVKGITAQSTFLSELDMKKEQYEKLIKHLNKSKHLQEAVKNPEYKKAFLDALHALIKELQDAS